MIASLNESCGSVSSINEKLFGSKVVQLPDDDKQKYEEERAKLFRQLSEKDEELKRKSQLAESYRLELVRKVIS